MGDQKAIYAPCNHIKRPAIDWTVDQDLMHSIATEFRTLPSFEKTSYEHILTRHYSLERNEFLKCRWNQYKSTIESKVFTPFEFLSSKDLHFYNNAVRYLPNLTISRQKSFKMQMKPGPGIDFKGQMNIPYEMFMKRGFTQKEDIKKIAKESKPEKKEETRDDKYKEKINKDLDVKQKNVETDNNISDAKKVVKTDLTKDDKLTKIDKNLGTKNKRKGGQ
ncbi:hypothetical protein O0L34_g12390 [Tuta absoluta]|nr:hypothetical protein O0L34_g12390 [Tuta absoluta]